MRGPNRPACTNFPWGQNVLPSLFSGEAVQGKTAVLALADGTVFKGISIGAGGHCTAEIVFNTLMSGHQEVITDPAYRNQIVAFTVPHVGNTGVNDDDSESPRAQVRGLVVRDSAIRHSNYRTTQSLQDYLQGQGVVAIAGVDTRKLTRILRDGGRQGACILVGDDVDRAVELARQPLASMAEPEAQPAAAEPGADADHGVWRPGGEAPRRSGGRWHVVAVDLGIRKTALHHLAERDCRVTRLAGDTSFDAVRALQPDGVFLSSGPGDPADYDHVLPLCRQLLESGLPVLATGLGMQLLARALGATVQRLDSGHHGGNHPVRDVRSGRAFIASLKQDYAIQADTLPEAARVSHVSLFDDSVQGFELADAPVMALQAYPEGSPGPHDLAAVFDAFVRHMANARD